MSVAKSDAARIADALEQIAEPDRADLEAYSALVSLFRERRHISLSRRADVCDALLKELRDLRADIDLLKRAAGGGK